MRYFPKFSPNHPLQSLSYHACRFKTLTRSETTNPSTHTTSHDRSHLVFPNCEQPPVAFDAKTLGSSRSISVTVHDSPSDPAPMVIHFTNTPSPSLLMEIISIISNPVNLSPPTFPFWTVLPTFLCMAVFLLYLHRSDTPLFLQSPIPTHLLKSQPTYSSLLESRTATCDQSSRTSRLIPPSISSETTLSS